VLSVDRRVLLRAVAVGVLAAVSRAAPSYADPIQSPVGVPSGSNSFDTAVLAQNELFDDFNGPAGSAPNSTYWLLDTINQSGYQIYTPHNVYLDGESHLVLQTTKSGSTYYSGRVTSRTKFNMQYGRLSASIKFPSGPGFHCGYWLLGIGYPTGPVSPASGEIDMQETFNKPTSYQASLDTHSPPHGRVLSEIHFPPAGWDYHSTGPDLSLAFHEYWVQRAPDSIMVGMDDTAWGTWTAADLIGDMDWTQFQAPFYLIMNFALESYLPPVDDTKLPAQMLIDWFRYTPLG
jgi:beta-glucanase (GH16 family)